MNKIKELYNIRWCPLKAALGLYLSMAAPPVLAAEEWDAGTGLPAPARGPATALPEVTVTAKRVPNGPEYPSETGYAAPEKSITTTKTDTPLIETPMSIQIVPREVLTDQNALRAKDALENVSGVRAQPSIGFGNSFIVRGFQNFRTYRNGLLANGADAGFPAEFDTANLANIEVLKGPSAMLFGRTEPGGIINVVTKRPVDKPYYSLEQQFGSYDFYRTVWDATGPTDANRTLLYRFSGGYQNNDSFRDFISNERYVFNPSITWRPSAATELKLEVEGFNQKFQVDFGLPVIGRRPAPIPISRAFGDPNDPEDNLSKVHVGEEFAHKFNENWMLRNRFVASFLDTHETFINPAPAFGEALRADGRSLDRNVFFPGIRPADLRHQSGCDRQAAIRSDPA